MADYLTERNGHWQFARRVPKDFAELDPRSVVKYSTKVEVAKDKRGRKAFPIAEQMNRALEAYWLLLSQGKNAEAKARYKVDMRNARILRFDHPDILGLQK
jgi:hypothetical protein